MNTDLVGFVGLGNIGGPLAEHLCQAGFDLIVFDDAGTAERAPTSARVATELEEIGQAKIVFLSLPNGDISRQVCAQIAKVSEKNTEIIVDLSTIGPAVARDCASLLERHKIVYVDSPISGSRQGAVNGTLTLMVATGQDILQEIKPLLDTFSKNIFHIGETVGQGQAMKLVNNFLAASVLTATTEAIIAGLKEGLSLEQMIDVINVSTGGNFFTQHVFPKDIIPGKYDIGFAASLLKKDLTLYSASIDRAVTPHAIVDVVLSIWQNFIREAPEADTSEIFRYMKEDYIHQ